MGRANFRAALAVLAIACASTLAAQGTPSPRPSPAPSASPSPICHSCFWQYFGEELKAELLQVYERYECKGPFCRAEVAYMLGTIRQEPARVRASFPLYEAALAGETDPSRRLVLHQVLGMVAPQVGQDPAPHFREAARLSATLRFGPWHQALLSDLAGGAARPAFGTVTIGRNLEVPERATAYVLGETTIPVRPGARVGVQLERTVRDWLSYKMDYDLSEGFPRLDNILDYHEGSRLRDLMVAAEARPVPLTGAWLARKGDRWYAPDENGVFRFHVLTDKVEYPTVKYHGGVALMTDTHGISSMVEQAVREKVDLVIGCGDNPGKAEASYHLANTGIDVYFPCDREVGMLLGHDAKGRILGTAPVRKTLDGAEIGNQPVRFSLAETIVVEDIETDGAHRYYDSPMRYFKALSALVPLKIHRVVVGAVKETGRATAEAERIGSRAIAVRVAFDEDYEAVKKWLLSSPLNRAVLFHSAPYKPGYRLFAEFPRQVTFGDPRPRFLTD